MNEAQNDGRACVICGSDANAMVPTGERGSEGSQLFRCVGCQTTEPKPDLKAAKDRLRRSLMRDIAECDQLYPYLDPEILHSPNGQPLAAQITNLRLRVVLALLFWKWGPTDLSRYVIKEVPRVVLSSHGMREAVLGTNDSESYRR